MIWPPIRYSYNTVNNELPRPAPSTPASNLTRDEACAKYPLVAADPNCIFGNLNWLGTDDQGRDVIARLIYGFRISVAFGLILTLFSSVIVWLPDRGYLAAGRTYVQRLSTSELPCPRSICHPGGTITQTFWLLSFCPFP
jgi:hypothetical protein